MSVYTDALTAISSAIDEFGSNVEVNRNAQTIDKYSGLAIGRKSSLSAKVLPKSFLSTLNKKNSTEAGDDTRSTDKELICLTELMKGDSFSLAGETLNVYGVNKVVVQGKVLNYSAFVRSDG